MSKKVDIKRGSTVVAVGEGLEYHGEWMQHGYVTVTVRSAVKVEFAVGDYVVFRNEKFYLWGEESWKKQARSGSYGEAYVYDNMKFWGVSILLEQVSFRDFVLRDTGTAANVNTYSSLGKFTFFGADVDDLADRIQANLNRVTTTIGGDTISFKVLTPSEARSEQRGASDSEWERYFDNGSGGVSETSKTDIVVNVDSETLWGGLAQAYNDFGMSFFVDGEYIVIGAPATAISGNAFVYGKGHELKTIEQHVDDQQRIVTRLFAYGSTKNMPANYYANQFRRPFILGTKTESLPGGTGKFIVSTYTTAVINKGILNVENPAVMVTYGSYKGVGYITGTNYEGGTVEYAVLSLRDSVWIDGVEVRGETDAATFYSNYDPTGSDNKIYITYGVDVNKWPASLVETDERYISSLVIQNLMLPGFPMFEVDEVDLGLYGWMVANGGEVPTPDTYSDDAEKGKIIWEGETLIVSKNGYSPWIQSVKSSVYGVREGDVYFDGSGDMEEIYPTIANTGANSVQSAEGFDDHGYLDEGGTFTLTVLAGSVPWNTLYTSGMTISMTSGFCTGRDFTVEKKPVLTNGSYTFTLSRVQDERGCFLPNVDSPIAAQDTFIVSGIELPAEYVEAASEALLRAAIAALKENDEPKRTYTPSINNIYMAKDLQLNNTNALHYKLRAGLTVEIQLDDAGTQDPEVISSVIDALTIKEDGGDGIATYDITLRDEKEKTLTQTISEAVNKGSGGGGGNAATSGRAYRLSDSTPRTAWGRQYWENGQPRDVSGTIDDAIDVNMSGTLRIDSFEVLKDADGRLKHVGDIYATGSVAALGYSAAGGGGSSVVLGPLLTELNDEPMPVADGYLHWTGSAFEWVEPGGGGDVPGTVAWNNITGKPATFPPSEHSADHDVRYYIENGTIHLGNNSITPITSHQSLAAYTPTANYQTLTIKGGTTTVGTYAPTQALSLSILAGSNINVATNTANKTITISNTYSYTHPTNGANTTITAANGKVLSAITVNSLGHVTSVSSKTLAAADIPDLSGTYLPLTIPSAGKTVNVPGIGLLTVKNTASDYPLIRYEGRNGGGLGFIGLGKTGDTIHPYYVTTDNNGGYTEGVSQWNIIWHSGNDGSGSGLDADLLDGHDSGYFATTSALTTLAGTVSSQGGRITTLEGYFENGVAKSAKRLSGTASYTAWGRTYWENGVPKSISGAIQDTNSITPSASGTYNIGGRNNYYNQINGQILCLVDSITNEDFNIRWWPASREVTDKAYVAMYAWETKMSDICIGSTNPTYALYFDSAHNRWGIGTDAPSQQLHVVGNIMATGAVSCLGTSAAGSEVTGASYLRDLLDVLITGTPQTNYVLTFNGSKWVPQASQGGDMSQYVTNTQLSTTLASYATQSWANGRFVTALGVSGNYLTYTKNGSTTNLTVPFATNADTVDGKHASEFVPKTGFFVNSLESGTFTPNGIILPLAWQSGGVYALDLSSELSGYLPLTAGINKPLTGNLAYKGTKATWEMVTFIDNIKNTNGNGIAIGGGGMTVIGGGESAANMASGWLEADQAHYGGDEMMFVANDADVSIFTNATSWANKKEFLFNKDGSLSLPLAAGDRKLWINSGSGLIYNAPTSGGWASSLCARDNAGTTNLGAWGFFGGQSSGTQTLTYLYAGLSWDNTWMVILPNGNLGIGTTSPAAKLDVVGNIGAKHTSGEVLALDSTASYTCAQYKVGGTAKWSVGANSSSFYFYSNNGSTIRMSILESGNVGIGTPSPGHKLDVNGAAHLSGDGSGYGLILANDKAVSLEDSGGTIRRALFLNANNQLAIGYGTTKGGTAANQYDTAIFGRFISFGTGGGSNTDPAIRMTISSAGNVGIGTNNPQHKLHVSGNVVATGAVSALGVSAQGTMYGTIVADALTVNQTATVNGRLSVEGRADFHDYILLDDGTTIFWGGTQGDDPAIYMQNGHIYARAGGGNTVQIV